VLGISVLGVLAVRGMHGSGDGGEPGTETFAIATDPADAQLVVDGKAMGRTPAKVDAKPGATVQLRKPGYLPVTRTLAAGEPVAVTLAAVKGFEGVWQLADGRLRRFARTGDRVDVYRREAVTGPDGTSLSYAFEETDAGVAFGTSELVQDERSADPSCAIRHRVTYHYVPVPETLTLALEKVGVKVGDDGRCQVTSSDPGDPKPLLRVDRRGDVRYSEAPVGRPPSLDGAKDRGNAADDRMDNSFDPPLKSNALKKNNLKPRAKKQVPQPLPPPPPPPSQVPQANQAPSQIVPQPQAPPINPEPEPQQQQQRIEKK
jgi:hypothetical protein